MEAFMKRFEVATWFTLKGVLKAKYIHHNFPEKKTLTLLRGYRVNIAFFVVPRWFKATPFASFLFYNKTNKFRTLRLEISIQNLGKV